MQKNETNSESKSEKKKIIIDENDDFFDDLYAEYNIDRVWASRSINSVPSKRGKLTEILVHNYVDVKGARNIYPIINPQVTHVAEDERTYRIGV